MRIHRVSVRDFRGVTAADITMAADGVTIVQGPNEVGKSTIADAIDMLLSDPDSSTKARVKAARPVGRDVGPWVEMEFETGPYRLTYAKRWAKAPLTELRVAGPVPQQLAGREAHDRVGEILAETLDAPLFAALRHQQGMPLTQAELGASTSLARALDVAAGAGSAPADDALVDRIDAERLRWTTPGGAPNKARLDLREAAESARALAASEHDRLAALEERVDEHRRLTREIADAEAREPEMRRRSDELQAALRAVAESEAVVRQLEQAADAAEAAAQAAAHAVTGRAALLQAVSGGEQRVAAAVAEGEAAAERVADAEQRCTQAGHGVATAAAALQHADAAREAAEAAARHLRDAFDLEYLEERRGQVSAAERRVAECEAFLAGCAMTADLMAAIEDAATEDAVARGRLQASGVRLKVTAERDLGIASGDGPIPVPAGESVEIPLAPGDGIGVDGVMAITLEGAAGPVREAADTAAQALAGLLARAGVPDADGVGAARALERLRLEHERGLASAREERQRALRDLTVDEMDEKIARARLRADAHGGADAAISLADADAAVARCDAARTEARRAHEAAVSARDQADAALRDLRALEAECRGRLTAERQRLDDDRAALEAARAEHADADIDARATAAVTAATAARERHAGEAAALAESDPESLRVRAANAAGAVDRLVRDRTELALAAERLMGEIGQAGDEGLADRAALAAERAQMADDALQRAEREAAAAELLHEVMTRHLDDARRSYVAPFRAEVERLARLVFGPGTSVEVDHASLQVVSRTRDGVTVPYEALSGGAREQLAVIGRLAAAAMVSGDGGAPVIIDDALGYSDPGRLEGLGAALASAAAGAQVIVLTCMPDRYASIGSATVVRMDPAEVQGSSAEGPATTEVA